MSPTQTQVNEVNANRISRFVRLYHNRILQKLNVKLTQNLFVRRVSTHPVLKHLERRQIRVNVMGCIYLFQSLDRHNSPSLVC